jgi:flagellar biosynthesis protein FliR
MSRIVRNVLDVAALVLLAPVACVLLALAAALGLLVGVKPQKSIFEIVGYAIGVAALWCMALFISAPVVVYGMRFWEGYVKGR